MTSSYIMAIDQGTTSSRAIIFDHTYTPIATAQQEFTQYFPQSGWVEHAAEEIWDSVVTTCRAAIEKAKVTPSQIAGIGITNQRETVVIWDKKTGTPIHKAIVWQDRRTSDFCQRLKDQGHEPSIRKKTGLLLDPYFSASKITWLLEHLSGARRRAENGELLCGTIDTYLLWKLTGGKAHKTDATNASRTLLYNIHDGKWDDDLLALFNIPRSFLPSVHNSADDFGHTSADILGVAIPVYGMAGDQQAATIGQACFKDGMIKSTYGTGCFVMLNTGQACITSKNRLLSTIAYQLDGQVTYALEGSIFIAGAAVQWLRDGLKLIDTASQSEEFAAKADDSQNIILVPAFAGLGAPYWKPDVRGALFGLTRSTGVNELCRATLEAICFQTRDLIEAMRADAGHVLDHLVLRVDGGMAGNNWAMQFLADMLDCQVERPKHLETTALGAAWLAGMYSGLWPDMDEFAQTCTIDQSFTPQMDAPLRAKRYDAWTKAVQTLL